VFKKSLSLILALIMLMGLSSVGFCTEINEGDESGLSGASDEAENGVPEKEGYVLDFSTEFNDGKLNTDYWLPQYLPHCTGSTDGASARYKVEDGCLNLYILKDSPDYFGGQPGSSDPDNLKWIANGIQTWEKNNLHPGGEQKTDVEPFEGYATQYGYFEIRMKMPEIGGGGYAAWWLIGAEEDVGIDGTSEQNGEIDIFETFFRNPGVIEPKVHAWNDPDLCEWSDMVELRGEAADYSNEFHTYAMDWRPEGITFYVDGKEISKTEESPQYRMCMILSMYINSDFSGWDEPSNVYPIEWLIDYIRVYKDVNGYDEDNRLSVFERLIKDLGDSLAEFGQCILSFFHDLCMLFHQFFEL